jgi:hypothetical protein
MRSSVLLDAVVRCLAEHPHDSTAPQLAARLGDTGDPDVVHAALELLRQDGLVLAAGTHHALTTVGWDRARAGGHR